MPPLRAQDESRICQVLGILAKGCMRKYFSSEIKLRSEIINLYNLTNILFFFNCMQFHFYFQLVKINIHSLDQFISILR
jgi:hypothetical protein